MHFVCCYIKFVYMDGATLYAWLAHFNIHWHYYTFFYTPLVYVIYTSLDHSMWCSNKLFFYSSSNCFLCNVGGKRLWASDYWLFSPSSFHQISNFGEDPEMSMFHVLWEVHCIEISSWMNKKIICECRKTTLRVDSMHTINHYDLKIFWEDETVSMFLMSLTKFYANKNHKMIFYALLGPKWCKNLFMHLD